MISLLLIISMLGVAFFNGANDVSKSIATLVGSGVTNLRAAICWGSLWTCAGAVCAALASHGLVAAFAGDGLLSGSPAGPALILSVSVGALAWIGVATLTGLPVSTTHALIGGLVGAGAVAVGPADIHWGYLLSKFALPLASSPLLSLALVITVSPFVQTASRKWRSSCVCVQQTLDGAIARPAPPP